MPAMRLTLDQAMRLWDLDRPTCCTVLESLVASHFLQQVETAGLQRPTADIRRAGHIERWQAVA